MRTFTLLFSALVLGTTALKAQTVATFDGFSLPGTDTFYITYASPGADVGFNDGLAHFPCMYDTTYGGIWSCGFSYSDRKDSTTSGPTNAHAAKTYTDFSGTGKYAAVNCTDPVTYASNIKLFLTAAAMGKKVSGFYVTNSTYAYNSMRDGDAFAHKFHSGDWFLLTVKGYSAGALKPDSVNFYLADFRHTDSTLNYIVKTWEWVNLNSLGNVDSLNFSLSSSDTAYGYMNTPSYFCIDNFTTNETNVGVANTQAIVAKVYPNPAVNALYVDAEKAVKTLTVVDLAGNVVLTQQAAAGHNEINTSMLAPGAYILYVEGEDGKASVKFVKQ